MEILDQSGKYKILVLGLDNSGKTSILVSMSKECNILSYCSLKPTKGINIKNFEFEDCKLNLWEFGGQKQYRKKYLADFNKYLKKVNNIIFVFDIQDMDRYDTALNYFRDIIDFIKNNGEKIELNIFLHKFDPHIGAKEGYKKIDIIVKKRLINKIEKIIPSGYPYKVFRTTIYSVFEKDLVRMNE
jgi:GTP-binding protein EngB required for normal cell division